MVDVRRRTFLKGLAVVAVGSMFTPIVQVRGEEKLGELPELPWPYEELDVEYVRKLGHLGYYAFECAGGSFWAIMTALREKVGYPYTALPIPTKEEVIAALREGRHLHMMMQYGAGGVFSWASTCGALLGSGLAINMVTKNWKKVGQVLMRWYETYAFPSDTANHYASTHAYLVPKYKSDKVLPRSVSHSVLCHVSVSRWCVASGYASGSPERSERCGRLTGDVAAKAVELLNADLKGVLPQVAKVSLSDVTADCRTCHYKGKNYEQGQFSRGFLECESCHRDMRPHMAETKLQTAFGTPLDTWAKFLTGAAVGGVGVHLIRRLVGRDHGED